MVRLLTMGLDPEGIRAAARLLREAQQAWALTGAGVSTASGIPDFRGPQGLWRTHNPEEVSTIEGFHHNPQAFYAFWLWRFENMRKAQPNPVHKLLAALEARGFLQGVITQNIDGLHQRAGSRRVLEVHGMCAPVPVFPVAINTDRVGSGRSRPGRPGPLPLRGAGETRCGPLWRNSHSRF
jgi:NAD-dependent deacetylase